MAIDKTKSIIRIRDLHKSYGDTEVLKGIDMDVYKGEVVVILGPSGSGKSTMLRCVNRLEEPTSGHIYFEDTEITDKKTNINDVRGDVSGGCRDGFRIHNGFHDADGSEQGGVLIQQDELVGHGGNDATESLRSDDVNHRLGAVHAQGSSSFELALTDGLNAGSEDFAKVGA